MSSVDWTQYNREDKENTAPKDLDKLVWVYETYCEEGVGLGYFDGFTFRLANGSDDCHVTHWAPIEMPEPPEGAKTDWDDDEEEDAGE